MKLHSALLLAPCLAASAHGLRLDVYAKCNYFEDRTSRTATTYGVVGDTVAWTRFCGAHTTTCDGIWDAPLDIDNPRYEHQFDLAGSYPYRCRIHGEAGSVEIYQPRESLVHALGLPYGQKVEGGLADMTESDDRYLEIRNVVKDGATGPPAQLILYGNALPGPVDYLRIRVESACSGFPFDRVRFNVHLFHWSTMTWSEIASARYFGYADEIREFAPPAGFSEFVDPLTREVRCRISWRDGGPVGDEWRVRIDEARFVFGSR